MTIWLASGNKHKQQELAAILGDNILKFPADAGIDNFEPEETGNTFTENALIKARTLHHMFKTTFPESTCTVLADDSGLCVDALGLRPGIYSARYYGINSWNSNGGFVSKINGEKLQDQERNTLLIEELDIKLNTQNTSLLQPVITKTRKCRFVCAMVLLFSPDHFYLVQETMEGEIVLSAKEISGSGGFGYDPIVYIPQLGRTVAELSEEEKNKLSHRGKAGKAIAKLLC